MCKKLTLDIRFAGNVIGDTDTENGVRATIERYFGLFPTDAKEEFGPIIRFRVISLARGGEYQTLVKHAPGLSGFITMTGIPAKVRLKDADSVAGYFYIEKNQRKFTKMLQDGPPLKDPRIQALKKEIEGRKKETQSLAEDRGQAEKALLTLQRRIASLAAKIESNNSKNEEAEKEIQRLTEEEFAASPP